MKQALGREYIIGDIALILTRFVFSFKDKNPCANTSQVSLKNQVIISDN
jgi:hypothetical protein